MNLTSRERGARWQRLSLALAAIVVIWGLVLPRLERMPTVQARIKHLNENGIDPAALFYSDHEGMGRWEASIRETQRQHPEAFWSQLPKRSPTE
ncbi:MAG: hypothetical protein H8E66_01655 [Planctomycetes bacterium]|nr:hypothetical protein [Planctomycetota bacterium]